MSGSLTSGASIADETLPLADAEENEAPTINIDGDIVFKEGSVEIPRYGLYARATAEDMDGDGDLDIVVLDGDGDSIDWYANDGQGNISGTATRLAISATGMSLEVADLDGDGINDFIVTQNGNGTIDPESGKVVWYKGNGDGTFGAAQEVLNGKLNSFDTAAADFDGDGDVDLLTVATGENGVIFLSTNDGNGNFTNSTIATDAVDPQVIRVVDINGDGRLDLVVGGAASVSESGWGQGAGVAVSINNGDGTFTNQMLTAATGNPSVWDVETADIDGDGHLDIVSTNPNASSVTWFKNNGDGTFGDAVAIGDPQPYGRVDTALGDVDGDGDVDIVTTESESADWPMKISWFENDGQGNFVEHKTSAVAESEATVVLADIDGNGVLDIVRGGRAGMTTETQRAADVQLGFQAIEVTENTATSLSSISFSDATTGASVTVTLTVGSGVLNAESGTGVTVAGGGTGALTLAGSIADINAFLAAGHATFLTEHNNETDVPLVVAIDDGMGADARTASMTVLLDVQPFVGEPPADLALDETTVAEDAAVGAVVGTLSATDPEGGALTYSLTDDAGGLFALSTDGGGTRLVVGGALDYESADGHQVTVMVTDEDGNSTSQVFDIAVGNVDEAPENLALSNASIDEDAAVGAVVGTLSATDPENAGAISYALTDDADGLFELVGNEIRLKAALDYETATAHDITVTATDATGKVATRTMTIAVGDVDDSNGEPAMITIDASTATAGMNFEAFIRGGFVSDATGGGFPVFDNGTAFEGEEMFIGYGSDAASKYVLMHGELEYYFGTHTVAGTANTIEYGTRGSGTYDADGYFSGGDVELRITGLDLSNPIPTNSTEEQEIEANGPIHNFAVAHMYGAATETTQPRYDKFADSLDGYAQHFIGSRFGDIYAGTAFGDIVEGKNGTDRLNGGAGDDTVDGGAGKDVLKGGAGADLIDGGKGIDKLYGNGGADTFVFDKGDTGKTKAKADTIFDFKPSQGDIIDLSDWDANSKKGGDQDFTFIGSQGFHGKAGELRFVKEKSDTWIMGDTNGDGKADFMIHLDDAVKLKVDHFDL